MTPGDLSAYLDVLRAAGVRRAKIGDVEVEFAAPGPEPSGATPAAPFVDHEGQPINLDEGNPWADIGDKILEKNFPGTAKAG